MLKTGPQLSVDNLARIRSCCEAAGVLSLSCARIGDTLVLKVETSLVWPLRHSDKFLFCFVLCRMLGKS